MQSVPLEIPQCAHPQSLLQTHVSSAGVTFHIRHDLALKNIRMGSKNDFAT